MKSVAYLNRAEEVTPLLVVALSCGRTLKLSEESALQCSTTDSTADPFPICARLRLNYLEQLCSTKLRPLSTEFQLGPSIRIIDTKAWESELYHKCMDDRTKDCSSVSIPSKEASILVEAMQGMGILTRVSNLTTVLSKWYKYLQSLGICSRSYENNSRLFENWYQGPLCDDLKCQFSSCIKLNPDISWLMAQKVNFTSYEDLLRYMAKLWIGCYALQLTRKDRVTCCEVEDLATQGIPQDEQVSHSLESVVRLHNLILDPYLIVIEEASQHSTTLASHLKLFLTALRRRAGPNSWTDFPYEKDYNKIKAGVEAAHNALEFICAQSSKSDFDLLAFLYLACVQIRSRCDYWRAQCNSENNRCERDRKKYSKQRIVLTTEVLVAHKNCVNKLDEFFWKALACYQSGGVLESRDVIKKVVSKALRLYTGKCDGCYARCLRRSSTRKWLKILECAKFSEQRPPNDSPDLCKVGFSMEDLLKKLRSLAGCAGNASSEDLFVQLRRHVPKHFESLLTILLTASKRVLGDDNVPDLFAVECNPNYLGKFMDAILINGMTVADAIVVGLSACDAMSNGQLKESETTRMKNILQDCLRVLNEQMQGVHQTHRAFAAATRIQLRTSWMTTFAGREAHNYATHLRGWMKKGYGEERDAIALDDRWVPEHRIQLLEATANDMAYLNYLNFRTPHYLEGLKPSKETQFFEQFPRDVVLR
eukprot:Gregarina_sp_Poly_1__10599@NODE_790_length_6283_cov_36_487934_g578_i0_p1_GENE_NODE_790_length_6283_cov_36_487934_g578_i0NODE_790_length_6283_cov_36_487934_g578_i0_p1_ORF_typecomplete_len707_score72_00Mvb12/PF09452_10/0_13Mvb12/PF09452_10/6e03_NODE_790_length_6283_cov_36_487934_g578_i011073227